MKSSRPYLIRALYDWIVDSGMTPHLLVDATRDDVEVPRAHAREGRIVLNVAPQAVMNLDLGHDAIEFHTRFQGEDTHVHFPVAAVQAIYARENGHGMMFESDNDEPPPDDGGEGPKARRAQLRVVK